MAYLDKRYQVFVSSTFSDLREERATVMQALLELDCIPAGMELFPASDEEQFEFIKKVIDDCDYYILIVGGRYGTISANGISYTEMEFDYAVSRGLPVLSFVHSNPSEIPAGKADMDKDAQHCLSEFRSKVLSGRLVREWATPSELGGVVSRSVAKAIKITPRIGWVKADALPEKEVLSELERLRRENDQLKSKKPSNCSPFSDDEISELAQGADKYTILGTVSFQERATPQTWEVELTWNDIFYYIASVFDAPRSLGDARKGIAILYSLSDKRKLEEEYEYTVRSKDVYNNIADQIIFQIYALGYLERTKSDLWKLSELGEKKRLMLYTLKRPRADTSNSPAEHPMTNKEPKAKAATKKNSATKKKVATKKKTTAK